MARIESLRDKKHADIANAETVSHGKYRSGSRSTLADANEFATAEICRAPPQEIDTQPGNDREIHWPSIRNRVALDQRLLDLSVMLLGELPHVPKQLKTATASGHPGATNLYIQMAAATM
jgi:hypothetical protein